MARRYERGAVQSHNFSLHPQNLVVRHSLLSGVEILGIPQKLSLWCQSATSRPPSMRKILTCHKHFLGVRRTEHAISATGRQKSNSAPHAGFPPRAQAGRINSIEALHAAVLGNVAGQMRCSDYATAQCECRSPNFLSSGRPNLEGEPSGQDEPATIPHFHYGRKTLAV